MVNKTSIETLLLTVFGQASSFEMLDASSKIEKEDIEAAKETGRCLKRNTFELRKLVLAQARENRELIDAVKEAYLLLLQMKGAPRTQSQATYCKLLKIIAQSEERNVRDVQDDFGAQALETAINKGWIN